MIRNLTAYSLLLVVPISVGCIQIIQGIPGSGTASTESREVDDFDKIDFAGAGSATITAGKGKSVEITVDDNLIQHVITEVKDGKLKIYTDENISPKIDLKVVITTPNLNGLEMSGAFSVEASGIDSESFSIDLSGAGSIAASGSAKSVNIDMSGAGSAKLVDLVAEEVNIDLAGAGSAKVHATKRLNADVAGVGSVRYAGDPENVNRDIAGIGSVKPIKSSD